MLDELEKQLLAQFEGRSACADLEREFYAGEVSARVSVHRRRPGRPTFRYWFGESRLDRLTFQTLTCGETRCPQRQVDMQNWLIHTGQTTMKRHRANEFVRLIALAAEELVLLDGVAFTAREAVFPMVLSCPQQAHEPVRIQVKGWDVFSSDGYFAGGGAGDRPMFETLEQVPDWLAKRECKKLFSNRNWK